MRTSIDSSISETCTSISAADAPPDSRSSMTPRPVFCSQCSQRGEIETCSSTSLLSHSPAFPTVKMKALSTSSPLQLESTVTQSTSCCSHKGGKLLAVIIRASSRNNSTLVQSPWCMPTVYRSDHRCIRRKERRSTHPARRRASER